MRGKKYQRGHNPNSLDITLIFFLVLDITLILIRSLWQMPLKQHAFATLVLYTT